jgi:mannose-6-phosphate isomerase
VSFSKLPASFHTKVWGSQRLSPWFADTEEKTGEVWFDPPADVPLLIKFLFTTENLSVQVHPADDYAREHHSGSNGKTEMWYILRTDPGAKIALGLREPLTPERLHEASLSGDIMNLLNWIAVQPGEIYFAPAGTIHAIGAGIALCEIQQISDVTYRLYDYGRDRELHLKHGVEVSYLQSHQHSDLSQCPYFRTSVVEVSGASTLHAPQAPSILICVAGEGTIDGQAYRPGEAWRLDETSAQIECREDSRFLLTYVPTR